MNSTLPQYGQNTAILFLLVCVHGERAEQRQRATSINRVRQRKTTNKTSEKHATE